MVRSLSLTDGTTARHLLVPPPDQIDVTRVDLDPVAPSPRPLGRDQRLARAQERAEDDLVSPREIEQRDRLDRWVILQAFPRAGSERRGAGIGPEIGAPAAAPAQIDVVDVRRLTLLE